MAIPWRFKAEYVKNCNCAIGCPCDFWAIPTQGYCAGMCAFRILSGHFGDVSLSETILAGTYHWPGALHEGNGTFQPYVLESATAEQREALLTIASGKAGNPWFEVLASVISTVLPPKFVPIEFQFDLNARRARVVIPGELETTSVPVINVATGQEHRVRLELPQGMEYHRPEIATTGVLRSTGPIKFECPPAHSSLAVVEHTQAGLVRETPQAAVAAD